MIRARQFWPATTRASGALATVAAPAVAFLLLLAAWQAVSSSGLVPSDMLPPPSRIVSAGFAERDALVRNTIPTLLATIAGFAFSVTLAAVTAALLDFSRVLRSALLPLLIVSQTLPLIALAPLVVLWFGFGLLPKILLVAFVTYFPMVVGLLRGFAAADPEAEHLLTSMGASRAVVFRLVRLPAATPSFFSALRISITYAVVGAIFAEYAGAVAGLGVYMQSAKNVFRTDLVLAAVFVSTALTLCLFGLVVLIERFAAPWLRIEQGRAGDGGFARDSAEKLRSLS
ncbi:ABC transporter permease [Leucobacter sp. NPDC058333]|uniref:ABC transporter permease n=1 Tax=Leucobacter sp. NPDC058333 TaxID=3346450 RepID=UPI00365AF9CF